MRRYSKAKEEATHVHRDGPRDNRNLYLAAEGQVHEVGRCSFTLGSPWVDLGLTLG